MRVLLSLWFLGAALAALPAGADAGTELPPAQCVACSEEAPCEEGLKCVRGVCRLPCEPRDLEQPCEACATLPDGTGVCACEGEVAHEGEDCGDLSDGGLGICAIGHSCVSTPSLCKRDCALDVPLSCGQLMECQRVSGTPVCIDPAAEGSTCNACREGRCDDGSLCHQGRCFAPCDPAAPTCGACLDVGGGFHLCACADQRGAAGASCSPEPADMRVCESGHACVDGTCRMGCNPAHSQCPEGERCVEGSAGAFCMPGTGPRPVEPTPDAGSRPEGPIHDAGCGCTQAGAAGTPLLLLLLATLRRRTRTEECAPAHRP